MEIEDPKQNFLIVGKASDFIKPPAIAGAYDSEVTPAGLSISFLPGIDKKQRDSLAEYADILGKMKKYNKLIIENLVKLKKIIR